MQAAIAVFKPNHVEGGSPVEPYGSPLNMPQSLCSSQIRARGAKIPFGLPKHTCCVFFSHSHPPGGRRGHNTPRPSSRASGLGSFVGSAAVGLRPTVPNRAPTVTCAPRNPCVQAESRTRGTVIRAPSVPPKRPQTPYSSQIRPEAGKSLLCTEGTGNPVSPVLVEPSGGRPGPILNRPASARFGRS